jgi:hypothetical protein
MNGVAWRADPDHCDILPERKEASPKMKTFGVGEAITDTILRPAVVSMAGGMLLVSDKAELYKDNAHIEGMKRSAPVLFTVPGQLYNNGGNGTWWMQEIERPFDHWSVLARFDWKEEGLPEQQVNFADLGLDPERDYLVFEFWTQQFLGKSKGSFKAPAPGSKGAMQVFAIREAREYPWVLSTTRHISQGGVELAAEKWDKASNTLTGTSAVIAGDPYVLTIHLPAGFKLKAAAATGEKVEVANQQEIATVRIVPTATKTVEWSFRFEMTSR